jgi:hypothetical protein
MLHALLSTKDYLFIVQLCVAVHFQDTLYYILTLFHLNKLVHYNCGCVAVLIIAP